MYWAPLRLRSTKQALSILDPQALCCCFTKPQSLKCTVIPTCFSPSCTLRNAQRSLETYVSFTHPMTLTQLARFLSLGLCPYPVLQHRIFLHSLALCFSCILYRQNYPPHWGWGLSNGRPDLALCWFFPFSFHTPPSTLACVDFEWIAQKLFYGYS